jgi:hypothetical protein
MPEERFATARSTGSGIGNPNALYRAFGRSAGLLKRAREFPDAHNYSLLIFLEASL